MNTTRIQVATYNITLLDIDVPLTGAGRPPVPGMMQLANIQAANPKTYVLGSPWNGHAQGAVLIQGDTEFAILEPK